MVTNGAEMRGFGEMTEWSIVAVLKTANREHRHPAENSQTRTNPSRNTRVPPPFARNTQAQEAAHMAWRYDPEKIERRLAEREARELIAMNDEPDSAGLCYFFGDEDALIKIGYSHNLHQRLAKLRSNTGPYKLRLLATARGGSGSEAHYHKKFRAHRSSGEWFEPAPEILAEIERLCSLANPAPECPPPPGRQSERGLTNTIMGGSHG